MLSHVLRCCLELSVVCQAILEYDLDAKKVSEGTGGEQVYGENNGGRFTDFIKEGFNE